MLIKLLECNINNAILALTKNFKTNFVHHVNSQIFSVDALPTVASPGPMMVYALTLNVIIVLGGRYLSVCCVADVLV